MDKIKRNLIIVNQDEKTGKDFAKYLESKIDQYKPDIVFVDPMLSYAGGDLLKQDFHIQIPSQ